MNSKLLIIIQGPTSIGKTSLSIQLAQHYSTEIISSDSRQFYKELEIGSAPPSETQLETVKHHFIHHLSITEDYNVGRFEKDAIKKIEELFLIHNKLIMVGGSGLYINAITQGFDEMPRIPNQIRKRIVSEYKARGISFLQNELQEKDPEYFKEVDKNNPQRLIRALEVTNFTGQTFSSFRINKNKKRSFDIVKIGLKIDRGILYNKINRRVENMMKKGLLKEASSLMQYRNQNALQTVGYKELFKYLDGNTTLDQAVEEIKKNTRRFAKRQITWFNKNNLANEFLSNDMKGIIRFIG